MTLAGLPSRAGPARDRAILGGLRRFRSPAPCRLAHPQHAPRIVRAHEEEFPINVPIHREGNQTKAWRAAMAAASRRLVALSLLKMLATWLEAVLRLMKSWPAISGSV